MIAKHHTALLKMLLVGYGVEDIALRLKVSPGEVREVVTLLRSTGYLAVAFSAQLIRRRNAALHTQARTERQPQPESGFSATGGPKGDHAPVGGLPEPL